MSSAWLRRATAAVLFAAVLRPSKTTTLPSGKV